MSPSPKMSTKILKAPCLWAHWGSKTMYLHWKLMWVVRYSKSGIYIKTSVSATAFYWLCVYQAQNHHTIHIGQQLCHNRHVPTPWHSAPLMSKCSVSEHVIQNLVHRAQSIALDLYTYIFYKFRVPNSQLVRAPTKNVTMTHFSWRFPLTWVRDVTKMVGGFSQHTKVFDTSLQGRSS